LCCVVNIFNRSSLERLDLSTFLLCKSQVKEIEGLAQGIASQAELDTIASLKNKGQEISKKFHDLKTSADTKAKAKIVADLAKLNASLGQVVTTLKSHAASK
jgi:hypothetical protein